MATSPKLDFGREKQGSFTKIGWNLERNRAQILLLTAQGETGAAIGQKVECSAITVRNVRFRWAKTNLSAEPLRKQVKRAEQQKRRERAFDGEKEAKLIALTCSTRWTLQLLQERVVEIGIVEGVAKETIRRTLKKTNSSHG